MQIYNSYHNDVQKANVGGRGYNFEDVQDILQYSTDLGSPPMRRR